MLLFQNDYLTIDWEKTIYHVSPVTSDSIWAGKEYLRLKFTIQCNGKIRRNELDIEIEFKEWFHPSPKSYSSYYAVMDFIKDMWYTIDESQNDIMDKAMNIFM